MRWLLVPHAQTDPNARGLFQGWSDAGLNDRGRLQAAALARRLRAEPIVAAHVSDLCRARQTAHAIALGRDFPIHVDVRLRERSFGDWEGRTREEVERMHPGALPDSPPHGESVELVAGRVRDFCRGVKAQGHAPEDTLLLVAHRGTLRVLLCLLLGMAPSQQWHLFLGHASLSEVFVGTAGCVLVRLNDTCHLEGA